MNLFLLSNITSKNCRVLPRILPRVTNNLEKNLNFWGLIKDLELFVNLPSLIKKNWAISSTQLQQFSANKIVHYLYFFFVSESFTSWKPFIIMFNNMFLIFACSADMVQKQQLYFIFSRETSHVTVSQTDYPKLTFPLKSSSSILQQNLVLKP